MKCTHPAGETSLRCAKCGTPICPRCLVQTPVGARCRDCANVRKIPTYSVTPRYYARAVAAGVVTAVGCGVTWGLVIVFVPSVIMSFLLAPLVGYAIGEMISLAVNRKRGVGLAITAAIMLVFSYLVGFFFPWGRTVPEPDMLYLVLDLVAVMLGAFVAAGRLR